MNGEATPYRVFARANLRITQLHGLAEQRFMLTMQLGPKGSGSSRPTAPGLPALRIQLAKAINRSIKRILRMLELAVTKCRPFVPVLVQKAQVALSPLWASVSVEDDNKSKNKISELVDNLTKLGIDVSVETKDWHDLEAVAFGTTLFPTESETRWEECADRAAELLKRIDDEPTRQAAERRIRDHLMRMKNDWMAANGYDFESHVQMLRSLAYAEGVDVDNGVDALSQAVRMGLKDLSPERVISKCEHLFVAMRAIHPLGRQLYMPSIGMKELWCSLHGHFGVGVDLDSAYQTFRKDHCDKCLDCKSRSADFRWSPDWQVSETKRLVDEGKILG
jgi:hypothetical protein